MADHDLDSLVNNLSLSSVEGKLLRLPSEDLSEGLDLCNRSLIGKFLAREEVMIKKSDMILAWESDFSFIHLRDNVYQFIFESEDKLDQIIENGPWCFDGIHLVLRKWRDDWESCKFDESEFWVHIVGLPLKYLTASVGKKLVSFFEGCKKVEIREEEDSGKRFFRLRIRVNVLEPFRRVILISSDDGKSSIRGLIQYERLPNLCCVCGLCDHTMSICNHLSNGKSSGSEDSELPFGPWLNADRKSSLLDELNLDEVQPKVVEFENRDVQGQSKNSATCTTTDVENQTTDVSNACRRVWTIENFSQVNVNKAYSDVFVVGGYKWRVFLYPKGNNVNAEFLPLYLDVADADSLPYGWFQGVQFSHAVVDQVHRKNTIRKETQHFFNWIERDWGFTDFMPISELNDPGKGFLVNDTIIIETDIYVPPRL